MGKGKGMGWLVGCRWWWVVGGVGSGVGGGGGSGEKEGWILRGGKRGWSMELRVGGGAGILWV